MNLLVSLLILLVAAGIGYAVAEDQGEELLFLRLLGYAVLGFFTFNLNGLPLPLGFAIALWLASRAAVNRQARQTASGLTFAVWLIGLLF